MNIVFASGGNDSVATVQFLADRGLTDTHVVYHNTGWASDWWSDRMVVFRGWVESLGFHYHETQSPGMANLVRFKNAWPRGGGGKYQFCTQFLKQKPAQRLLSRIDPDCDATCIIGVRRCESANRANHPEFIESSEDHGGRELWAPLVRHDDSMRDALISKTPFTPLPFRSKECWPCVNARKGELRELEPETIDKIRIVEIEMGNNSEGNPIVMFSPAREGGAVGIDAVVANAKNSRAQDMPNISEGCNAGWCGD